MPNTNLVEYLFTKEWEFPLSAQPKKFLLEKGQRAYLPLKNRFLWTHTVLLIPLTVIFAPSIVKFLKRDYYTPLSFPVSSLTHKIRLLFLPFDIMFLSIVTSIFLKDHHCLSVSFDVVDYSTILETAVHMFRDTSHSWFPFCLTVTS